MIIKMQKIGNNLGIILPKQIIDEFNIEEEDSLVIEKHEDGIYLHLRDPDFAQWLKAYHEANREYKEVLQELAK